MYRIILKSLDALSQDLLRQITKIQRISAIVRPFKEAHFSKLMESLFCFT
uniref:Uncharacterized protein n=1 Tax=Tetranychus urticae TaxID=32264 RepID=T1L5X8_TETUR